MADTRRLTYEQIAALLTRIQASMRCTACSAWAGLVCAPHPSQTMGEGRWLGTSRRVASETLLLPSLLCISSRWLSRDAACAAQRTCHILPALPPLWLSQDRFGWQPIIEDGNIIGLTQDGQVGAAPCAAHAGWAGLG